MSKSVYGRHFSENRRAMRDMAEVIKRDGFIALHIDEEVDPFSMSMLTLQLSKYSGKKLIWHPSKRRSANPEHPFVYIVEVEKESEP